MSDARKSIRDRSEALPWRDANGEIVPLSANLMLKGGHWHGGKMLDVEHYARTAATSPFLKQIML